MSIFAVLDHICGANAADLSSAFFVPVGDNLLQPRKCWVVETPHRFADMNGAALHLAFLFAKSYLMNPLRIFSYNGSSVSMTRNENGVVYVNLTEFAKPFPSKNLTQIINSREIREYCEALSKLQNYSLADLLLVTRGGSNNGTWAHQKVALRVAQKLSPDFAVWVDAKIEEILTQGIATVRNDDEAIAYAMEVLNRRLVESRRQLQAAQLMLDCREATIQALAPKAQYADEVLQSTSTYTLTQIAHDLGLRSVYALTRFLSEKHILYRQSGQWQPTAKVAGRGYFETRTAKYVKSDNTIGTNLSTVVTEFGRQFLHNLINKEA